MEPAPSQIVSFSLIPVCLAIQHHSQKNIYDTDSSQKALLKRSKTKPHEDDDDDQGKDKDKDKDKDHH